MTWPDDYFEGMIKEQEESMAKHGLRLSSIKEFSELESGLNKLLFDSPKVIFEYKQFKGKIDNIEFHLRKKVIGNQTDEEEYRRIIVPVWMMRGYINGDMGRIITGVIGPEMLDLGEIIKPALGLSPKFHFYIDEFEGCQEGRNVEEYGPDGLLCGVKECKEKNLNDITPYFHVDKRGFTGMCRFYVEK